jgi:hypothetical protein
MFNLSSLITAVICPFIDTFQCLPISGQFASVFYSLFVVLVLSGISESPYGAPFHPTGQYDHLSLALQRIHSALAVS